MESTRSPELLDRSTSRLLVVDMQERLLAVMPEASFVTGQCELLIRAARALAVPVDASEQYPRGLGSTVEPLKSLLGPIPDKLRFSAATSFEWSRAVGEESRHQIVLCGIEAHVCVLQTAFDLLAGGFSVFVVADAVASRRERDARIALDRLRDSGATVTTTESVIFEWCEAAGSDEFKQISALIKARPTSP